MTGMVKKLGCPLILLALLASAQAQETAQPDETGADTGQTQAQTEEDTGEAEENPSGAADSAEAFIPTETISEDLSVPFPVDI